MIINPFHFNTFSLALNNALKENPKALNVTKLTTLGLVCVSMSSMAGASLSVSQGDTKSVYGSDIYSNSIVPPENTSINNLNNNNQNILGHKHDDANYNHYQNNGLSSFNKSITKKPIQPQNQSNSHQSNNHQNNSHQGNNYSNSHQNNNNNAPVAFPVAVFNKEYQPLSYDSSTRYYSAARTANNRGNVSALRNYKQDMKGGLFAMYPEYWLLNRNISNISPVTAVNYANRYPKTVMVEKLLADYAETKARSSEYQSIQHVAPYVINADKSEACALAIGDIKKGSMRLPEQKSKVWLNTLEQPSLCNKLALALNHSSVVNNKDREERLIRMLRTGKQADIVTLSSKLGLNISYSQLQTIKNNPRSFLTSVTYQSYSRENQFLYLYAIGRITDLSYRQAESQLRLDIQQDNQRKTRLLSQQARRMAYRNIAVARMNMNTDHGFNKEVIGWFRNSLGEPFNYEEAEDYAMAAIRFSEWKDVINAINGMDAGHQHRDAWQYWLARAHQQLGRQQQATALYKEVAKKDNYYGYLAKDKLGQPINLSLMGGATLPVLSTEQQRRLSQNQNFSRALALYGVNSADAKREWNWGVRRAIENNDKQVLIAAARKGNDIGWYDRSIYAMEKANESMGILSAPLAFPTPRKYIVTKYANQVGIDPAWAYGIMRQESRFNVKARSHVGAGGLMQVMPATGKYIARKMGERYNANRIASGETNIRYGTWYMSDVFNSLGRQAVLATAGYNAGPGKARRWQPKYNSLPADQYVESIPYPETRDYVKLVMENSTVYGYLLGNPKTITQRMGTIYPH